MGGRWVGVAVAALWLAWLASPAAAAKLALKATTVHGISRRQGVRSLETNLSTTVLTFGPCSGIAPHHHNSSELIIAVAGATQVALVVEDNVTWATVQPGELFEVPSAVVHYSFNPHCRLSQVVALLSGGAFTQFEVTSLQAIPDTLFRAYFARELLPGVQQPGFPFSSDAACLQACSASQGAAGSEPAWAAAPPAGATPPVAAADAAPAPAAAVGRDDAGVVRTLRIPGDPR